MNRGIVLLSGGLDSLVSLGISKDKYNIELAITFDYGQKSAFKEIRASEKICKYYSINHKIINLEWLKDVTHTALVSEKNLPETIDAMSAKNVWVPNRNGLFLNIAGAFADGEDYKYVIIGANKEEAETFSDNTKEFIDSINNEFEYSTAVHPKVIAPLINCNKNDIVKIALEQEIPLNLVQSCYDLSEKHCGKCESCTRLKNALKANNAEDYIKELF